MALSVCRENPPALGTHHKIHFLSSQHSADAHAKLFTKIGRDYEFVSFVLVSSFDRIRYWFTERISQQNKKWKTNRRHTKKGEEERETEISIKKRKGNYFTRNAWNWFVHCLVRTLFIFSFIIHWLRFPENRADFSRRYNFSPRCHREWDDEVRFAISSNGKKAEWSRWIGMISHTLNLFIIFFLLYLVEETTANGCDRITSNNNNVYLFIFFIIFLFRCFQCVSEPFMLMNRGCNQIERQRERERERPSG